MSFSPLVSWLLLYYQLSSKDEKMLGKKHADYTDKGKMHVNAKCMNAEPITVGMLSDIYNTRGGGLTRSVIGSEPAVNAINKV